MLPTGFLRRLNVSAVKFENVSFSYTGKDGSNDVVKDVSFEIERGEFVAIIGRNAGGKSTLAKLINGLIIPRCGTVTVCGMPTTTVNGMPLDNKNLFEIRKRCGIVFQNPDNQMVASIVEDDVAFGPENLGLSREEIGERIEFALSSTGTEQFRTQSASKLSGGQKQRVAIAGVLALKPEILILDESTSMLDPKGRNEVMSVVRELNKNGMTVIVITHYMDEITDCSRVFVMGGGKLLAAATPKEIFANDELLERAGLELPIPAKIAKRLKALGVDAGLPLTKEELKENLWTLLQKS